jgi:hypothetical protein
MSVSGIVDSIASGQTSAVALPIALRNTLTQKQDFGSTNLDVPSDAATFQQLGNSSSANSISGNLTAVQKAYASFQQIAADPTGTNTVDPTNLDPRRVSGGPVHRSFWGANPVRRHDLTSVGLPNPIRGHDPMPPIFESPVGGPSPVQTHDPMPPIYRGAVSVVA